MHISAEPCVFETSRNPTRNVLQFELIKYLYSNNQGSTPIQTVFAVE